MVNTNKVPLRRIEGINNYKTNCITEIPQDIKLELADGVLTLKAGSKVYVPNGFEEDGTTPKFDEIKVNTDLTMTYTEYNNTYFVGESKDSYRNLKLSLSKEEEKVQKMIDIIDNKLDIEVMFKRFAAFGGTIDEAKKILDNSNFDFVVIVQDINNSTAIYMVER